MIVNRYFGKSKGKTEKSYPFLVHKGVDELEDCLFCKRVNGRLHRRKIVESENILVFLDNAGDVDGHMIALVKKHRVNLIDCEQELFIELMNVIRAVSLHCVENCGFDGVNLIKAEDETVEEHVSHLHFHIIPRKKQDGVDAWPLFTGAMNDLETMHQLLDMKQRTGEKSSA